MRACPHLAGACGSGPSSGLTATFSRRTGRRQRRGPRWSRPRRAPRNSATPKSVSEGRADGRAPKLSACRQRASRDACELFPSLALWVGFDRVGPSRRSDGIWDRPRADRRIRSSPTRSRPARGPRRSWARRHSGTDQRTAHPLAATTIATATEATRARDGKLETCCGMASSIHVVQA